MPRVPRNPGTGKAPVNTPASGPGYGGARKGEGANSPRHPLLAGNMPRTGWRERKAELGEKAMQLWEDVLDDPDEPTNNKIVAAEKIMDRVDGKPKQVQEHQGDLSFTIVTGVPRAND
jgi:hypothetical protein